MIGKDQPPSIGDKTQIKPGDVLNPNGRPKGSRNLSAIVQSLLDDPEFAENVIQDKPGWWSSLPNKNLAEAISAAMVVNAVKGDQRAAEWLRKTGWGDKVTHDFEPGLFTKGKLEIEIVDGPQTQQETEEGA